MFYSTFAKLNEYVCPSDDEQSDELIVERAGYRTAQEQIESFLLAGQSLQASREELYNSYDELEDPNFFNGDFSSDNDLLQASPLHVTQMKRMKVKSTLQKTMPTVEASQDKDVSRETSATTPDVE